MTQLIFKIGGNVVHLVAIAAELWSFEKIKLVAIASKIEFSKKVAQKKLKSNRIKFKTESLESSKRSFKKNDSHIFFKRSVEAELLRMTELIWDVTVPSAGCQTHR